MNFDDWKDLWQKQPQPPPPDAAAVKALLRRVRAEAHAFDRTILWRDLREVFAALLVFWLFARKAQALAVAGTPAWNLVLAWLAAALPLGVAGFLVIDRLRTRRLRPQNTGTVLSEIDHALAELRHQHRLLMGVAWWYLLPLAISTALFMVHPVVKAGPARPAGLVLIVFTAVLLAAINYPLWRLNRRVAAKSLAPRIEQLEHERRDFASTETYPSKSA